MSNGSPTHPTPPQSEQLGETRESGSSGSPVLLWQRLRSWLGIAERLWGRHALADWLGTGDLAAEVGPGFTGAQQVTSSHCWLFVALRATSERAPHDPPS